jgi:tetratricopeptide (TPR) repeat protein
VLGKEHPSTLNTVWHLASLYHDQRRYEDAAGLYKRAVEGFEKVLGPDHPDRVQCREDYSTMKDEWQVEQSISQGDYTAAEELYRKMLDRREEALGKEHLDTLVAIWNLALVLYAQRRYKDAAGFHERALLGFKKALGPNHPRTVRFRGDYSAMKDAWRLEQSTELINRGEYAAAEELLRKMPDKREEVLGKEHPDTLFIVWHLAALFHKQRRFEDASVLYERALAGFKKALGPDHPNSVGCHEQYSDMKDEWRLEQSESDEQVESNEQSEPDEQIVSGERG